MKSVARRRSTRLEETNASSTPCCESGYSISFVTTQPLFGGSGDGARSCKGTEFDVEAQRSVEGVPGCSGQRPQALGAVGACCHRARDPRSRRRPFTLRTVNRVLRGAQSERPGKRKGFELWLGARNRISGIASAPPVSDSVGVGKPSAPGPAWVGELSLRWSRGGGRKHAPRAGAISRRDHRVSPRSGGRPAQDVRS
jgi:hypothetical protein